MIDKAFADHFATDWIASNQLASITMQHLLDKYVFCRVFSSEFIFASLITNKIKLPGAGYTYNSSIFLLI